MTNLSINWTPSFHTAEQTAIMETTSSQTKDTDILIPKIFSESYTPKDDLDALVNEITRKDLSTDDEKEAANPPKIEEPFCHRAVISPYLNILFWIKWRNKLLNQDPTVYSFQADQVSLFNAKNRLMNARVEHEVFGGSMFNIIDGFITAQEGSSLQKLFYREKFFTGETTFHWNNKNSPEKVSSLSNKQLAKFFTHPPEQFEQLYPLFAYLGEQLDAAVTTHPWRVQNNSTFVGNFLKHSYGKKMLHLDYNPKNPTDYRFPKQFFSDDPYHSETYENGAPGQPWLCTALFYVAAENFQGEKMGMGTVALDEETSKTKTIQCKNGRLVLFEGNIPHGIGPAFFEKGEINTWRWSTSLTLAFLPKKEGQCSIREQAIKFFASLSKASSK